MSYQQMEEPRFSCPKCKREFSLNTPQVLYGLFQGGKLVRCQPCFEQLKHKFWIRQMAEEDYE